MNKAYLDTNILIAYSAGEEKEPRQFPKAKAVFDKIREGAMVGVVSTLTLTEIIGVLRTHFGRELDELRIMDAAKRVEHVRNEAQTAYDELVGELLKMPNIKLEKGKQSNFQAILEDSHKIMQDIRGVLKIYPNCGVCRQAYENSVHKQILVADILHALLAKDTGCDSLWTFDKGFHGLENIDSMDSLEIKVL